MILDTDERIEEALRASTQGDKLAFSDVCNWCGPRLLMYCRSRLRYEDLRSGYQDDLMNKVLHRFWREIQNRITHHELTIQMSWCMLRRIAKSLAYDHYRTEYCPKRRPAGGFRNFECNQHSPSVRDSCNDEFELMETWAKFLDMQSESDRKLIEMRLSGMKVEDIARELQVGTSTLYNRLQNLASTLKSVLWGREKHCQGQTCFLECARTINATTLC